MFKIINQKFKMKDCPPFQTVVLESVSGFLQFVHPKLKTCIHVVEP